MHAQVCACAQVLPYEERQNDVADPNMLQGPPVGTRGEGIPMLSAISTVLLIADVQTASVKDTPAGMLLFTMLIS